MSNKIPSLQHITLSELHHHLSSGHVTHRTLVEIYLRRITEVNSTFNAVLEINPSTPEEAFKFDIPQSNNIAHNRPLHGLPILLKDNLPTLDNTQTTCGSHALLNSRAQDEAAVVKAVRSGGGLILGKGNMAQWSGFRSTSGCSGWSARGGQCTGVFYPGMKASGSSSGCAVAVSLGLCFAAIGTGVYFSPRYCLFGQVN